MEIFFGFIAGMVVANLIHIFTRSHKKPPAHTHFFEPWSEPLIENLKDDDGDLVGRVFSQQRTCIECGFSEYRRESFSNNNYRS